MAVNNFYGIKKGLNIKPSTLPVSGNLGDLAFDEASNSFKQWNGTNWADITGGVGGINYIDNPMAENAVTIWATYADAGGALPVDGTGGVANVTFTRSTSAPLRDVASFLFTKDAANRQGQGASYDLLIDDADKGKVLTFSMDYAPSANYVSGDMIFYVYDVTNATLIQPTPYQIPAHQLSADRFSCQIQTNSNSNSYRIIFHVSTTSALAYTMKIDNLSFGPNPRTIVSNPSVTYYNTVSAITGVSTVTADTPVDVPNATLTLSEPGNYELIYESYIGISSANGERVGVSAEVMITDNANTVIDEARQLFTASISATGRSYSAPVRCIARVTITGTQTYKVRLVNGESAANSVAQTGFADPTGSLTGNDTTNKFYARRIVNTATQIKDDGYASSRITFQGYANANQALTALVTDIALGGVDADTAGGWDGSGYVVKTAGDYHVDFNLATTTTVSADYYWYVNGVIGKQCGSSPGTSRSKGTALIHNLKAGDRISFRTATSSVTIASASDHNIAIFKIPSPAQVIEPLILEYTDADKEKNFWINSDFELWQRGSGPLTFGSIIQYHADRFAYASGTVTGTVKSEKIVKSNYSNSSSLPISITYMQRYEVQTAQPSLSAGSTAGPWYKVEGFDWLRMLQEGAYTRGFTLSFYVGATVGGTYTIELFNSGIDNRYFTTYTVVGGTTWQRVSIHVPAAAVQAGIASGSWNYTNGVGLGIRFWLAAGTTSHGGTQNAWTGATANVPATQVNVLATSLNTWGITGVMLNIGNIVADYRKRSNSWGEEIQLARRYYTSSWQIGENPGLATTRGQFTCIWLSGNRPKTNVYFKNSMRGVPTITIYNVVTGATGSLRGETGTDVTAGVDAADIGTESFSVYQATLSSTNAAGAYGNYTADAEI